jgi:membrane-associated phospholipid phosphatase
VTNRIAEYLWGQYGNNELGLGAGISAMPSLHVAMVTWIVLSLLDQKSRATPFAILFALFNWGASVALGWHYASDGLAGIIGAIVFHRLSRHHVEQFRIERVRSVELA